MKWTKPQRGWSTAEYLAVLVGLIAVWQVTRIVLQALGEHHYEFCWTLTIPF